MADPTPIADDRIGFSHASGLVSRAIRWITGSRASHAFVVYYDTDFQQDMVLEAVGAGFRIQSLDTFKKENEIVRLYQPQHSLTAGYPEVAHWLGERYDFGGLLGMAWVMIGRWLKRNWRNPWASSRSLFCSEAVVRVLLAARYPRLPAAFGQPDRVTPEDLLRWVDTGP
jgi:hypothetical protein